MNEDILIEKDIPIPGTIPRRYFPFDKMEVGDSFMIIDKSASMLTRYATIYKETHPDVKFLVRAVSLPDGDGQRRIRCWRTE